MQWAAHGRASSRSGGDGVPAADAPADSPVVEPGEGRFDGRELLLVSLAQGEVAQLLEHLGGRRGLRAVGHRTGRDDAFGDLGAEPVALAGEGDGRVDGWLGHGRIVQAGYPRGLSPARELSTHGDRDRPRLRDGGRHDNDRPQARARRQDVLVLWPGCLLEFRDDPDRFLDPEYEPSM
jgi:hypothetical protein